MIDTKHVVSMKSKLSCEDPASTSQLHDQTRCRRTLAQQPKHSPRGVERVFAKPLIVYVGHVRPITPRHLYLLKERKSGCNRHPLFSCQVNTNAPVML